MSSTYFEIEGTITKSTPKYSKEGKAFIEIEILPLKSLGDYQDPVPGVFSIFGKTADLMGQTTWRGQCVELTGEISFRAWKDKTYPQFNVKSVTPKYAPMEGSDDGKQETKFSGNFDETISDVPF